MKNRFVFICVLLLGCSNEPEVVEGENTQSFPVSQVLQSSPPPSPASPLPQIAQSVEISTCPEISDLAESLIAAHSDKIWGSEYCRFRSAARNQSIEVVIFTLEGQCRGNKSAPKGSCGNNYSRYMVGVLNGKPIDPIPVGSKVDFLARTVSVINEEIIVSGFFHQDGDGLCCPSKKGIRKFSYQSQKFEKVFSDEPEKRK